MISVALYEPEIPGNTGNIARLCAATGAPLHLIGRLGFSFRHPEAQRAGMDYWKRVDLNHHVNYADFIASRSGGEVWGLSTRGTTSLWDADFGPDDALLFGPESRGLPDSIVDSLAGRVVRIPMRAETRSLNLSASVAVTLYEALRRVPGDHPIE